ncbi:lipase maturation factor family protein [bacterium]|nr:lipase maturation factor family protein [bacterium]
MNDRRYITRIFIPALGILHLFNFASLAEQVQRCMGSDGLLPAAEYVRRLWDDTGLSMLDRIVECPSLFLWFSSDAVLVGGAWLGVALAVLAGIGIYSRVCFAAMFVLYASYIEVGGLLYSFQWDSLILETTFLAILLPCSGLFFCNWRRGADPLTAWLFRWLMVRLYLESGLAKLFWGPDTWATLDAMRRYYETAPIPTVLGWVAHALPESWHQFETGATLCIEILGSTLIFAGLACRRLAFVIFTAFQTAILLTANYGIFNYTSLALHLFLLTDADIAGVCRLVPSLRARFADISAEPLRPRWWVYPLSLVIVVFSLIEFLMLAGGQAIHTTRVGQWGRYIHATHISSRYHLFGPIDPIRYEMVFEASPDFQTWYEYEFPYKAGALDRPPPFVAPHHPRVDFRLWFERYPLRWGNAAMPYPDASAAPQALPSYVGKLAVQLLEEPNLALRHFVNDPLNGTKPADVRITFYHYRMTRRGAPESKERYWDREKVGTLYVDPNLGKEGRPTAVPQRTTVRP